MARFDIQGSEDPMSTLCRMAIETSYDDLPDDLIAAAKHCLLDGMAVLIGGSAFDGIPQIAALVKAKGGAEQTPLPFYGGKVPASEAALLLGPMPRAMDCGDLHEEAGHVGEYLLSSLLAATGLAGRAVSGRDFLTAYAVGQEVMIRIGSAYKVISEGVKAGMCGGHYVIAATVAVGTLLRLTQDQLENAVGIARTMTQPTTMSIYSPPTLMVRVHHGLVCQAAITACELALSGITGPRASVLTGPHGYLNSVPWPTDPQILTSELGDEWLGLRVTTKGHSACYFSHSSVDAIIDQLTSHGFDFADIESIHAAVSEPSWQAVCEPVATKWNPRTVPECQFSLPYAIASAAHDRKLFVDSYSDDVRDRPAVRDLMERITATVDSSVSDWGVRLRTTLRDGREFRSDVTYVKGHPDNPFSASDLVDKFRRCVPFAATPVSDSVADAMITSCLTFEDVEDVVAALLLPLVP